MLSAAGAAGERRPVGRTDSRARKAARFSSGISFSDFMSHIGPVAAAALQRFPQQFPKQINRENISMIREFLRDNRESIRQTRSVGISD
jgi:hypothetical protein